MCACCEVLFFLSFRESSCYGFSLSFAPVHSIVSTAVAVFFYSLPRDCCCTSDFAPRFLSRSPSMCQYHTFDAWMRAMRIVRISWRDDGWAISVRILCVYDKYAYVSTTQCERDSFVRVPHSFTRTSHAHTFAFQWFLYRPNNDNTLYGIQYTHQHVWTFWIFFFFSLFGAA